MSRTKGFTLVELLVVIAIIALLMSILMPALSRAKKQANTVLCQSKLGQWGAIFSAYTDDYDGYFQGGYGGGNNNWWQDATRSYYDNVAEARCCPSASNPDKTDVGGFVVFGVWTDRGEFLTEGDYGSYGINGWVENKDVPVGQNATDPSWRWRTPNVRGATYVPLFMDAQWIDCWPLFDDRPPDYDGMPWNEAQSYEGMGRFCINRHEGHINCLFLDFSVKKIGLKQMWTLKWHRQFDTCNEWTICGGADAAYWHDEVPWMDAFPVY
jgi:prepilin-type N-terminal cleavage/methylation domain-containing protein/prepilin-type processing-associated H-X9-DG protein